MEREVKQNDKMFYIKLDEEHTATLEYEIKRNSMVDFTSTYTPDEYRGQGVGSQLIKRSLDWAVNNDYRIIATCPFVQSYIKRHPEYKQYLAEEID